eukprot:COSAG04_NODE_7021_length_1208_cov_1.097385_2_plen_169_part_00
MTALHTYGGPLPPAHPIVPLMFPKPCLEAPGASGCGYCENTCCLPLQNTQQRPSGESQPQRLRNTNARYAAFKSIRRQRTDKCQKGIRENQNHRCGACGSVAPLAVSSGMNERPCSSISGVSPCRATSVGYISTLRQRVTKSGPRAKSGPRSESLSAKSQPSRDSLAS